MRFISYTKTDTYYEFVGENGEKMLIPATDVVLVDDESGAISIKNTASRCTIGLLKIAPPAPSYMFTATYTGGTTYSAECDSSTELTSAITKPEGYEYTSMTSAIIGDCVTSIGNSAFQKCYSLSSIDIPDSVTSIDASAFTYCSGLTNATIGSGVTSIGKSAFQYCGSLSSVTIPDSVTIIDNYIFSTCSGLTSIDIPNSVTKIGLSSFAGCYGLTSINIPSGVTSIDDFAFRDCVALTSINIPSGVTSLGSGVFRNCYSFTSIDIPSGVTSIGNYAFRDCSGLTAITVNATTPPTLPNANAFSNTNDCPIYVPASSVETYKSASGWSTYASRITAIPNS